MLPLADTGFDLAACRAVVDALQRRPATATATRPHGGHYRSFFRLDDTQAAGSLAEAPRLRVYAIHLHERVAKLQNTAPSTRIAFPIGVAKKIIEDVRPNRALLETGPCVVGDRMLAPW